MTHTEMLEFIRMELAREGVVWKSEKELFQMLVKDEPWEKYRSNWDSWKNKKVQYLKKSFHILIKIANTLGFDPSVWDNRNEAVQKSEIRKAVRKYCKAKDTIDLSALMPPDPPLTEKQKRVLREIERVSNDKAAEFLELYPELFSSVTENQTFLLRVTEILYMRGLYDFLDERVFPSLLPHNRADPKVRIVMAHTFGSLSKPKYLEAAKLLETIKSDSDEELIDLKTSVISNIRREILTKEEISEEEIKSSLEILGRYYKDIYEKGDEAHYYPAINLAYILKIYESLFFEKMFAYDVDRLYKECKNSVEIDKSKKEKDLRYYAWMSESEFKMLAGKRVSEEIYLIFEELKPSLFLIDRTLRQMEFFKKLIVRSPKRWDNLPELFRVMEILREYGKIVS